MVPRYSVWQKKSLACAVTGQPSAGWTFMKYMCGDSGYGDLIRETREEVAAGHLGPREALLRVGKWKTVQLMGIMDRLCIPRDLIWCATSWPLKKLGPRGTAGLSCSRGHGPGSGSKKWISGFLLRS